MAAAVLVSNSTGVGDRGDRGDRSGFELTSTSLLSRLSVPELAGRWRLRSPLDCCASSLSCTEEEVNGKKSQVLRASRTGNEGDMLLAVVQ